MLGGKLFLPMSSTFILPQGSDASIAFSFLHEWVGEEL